MMVSPEECMGCSGLVACNYSYFPDIFNEDGTRKETQNASTESGRS